jgi:hypothetical protein
MRRRQFIAIIGCATAAWSSKVHGQQPTMPVVGFLNGGSPVIVKENLGADMCRWYQAAGLFGGAEPVLRVVGRVERLAPAWVHPMHGGSLTADALPGYTAALRTLPFTFDGRLFGRQLPNGA